MRELTSHKVNGLNEALRIVVYGQAGIGGAHHEYQVRRVAPNTGDQYDDVELCLIKFQEGPIAKSGVNGISNEALLAIVEDRLLGFQGGPYACDENAKALAGLQECIMWMHTRTRNRTDRGVEGTHEI